MYPISEYVKKLYKENYRQVVEIIFHGKNRTFTLTESDIRQGGLSIDRYCVSNTKLELGSAVAAELSLTLENTDDRFADEVFEDAELEVKIGVKKWDAGKWENAKIEWIPCGFFTIDDPPRKLTSITLSALDRMVKFDTVVTGNIFPASVKTLIETCCTTCGVPLHTDLTQLPNYDYMITYVPEVDEELTYRQLIQWAAQLTGTCAYIDWNGELRLEWYSSTDINITPSDRYSSDLYENDVTITGIQITDENDSVYLKGTDDYAFNIMGNKLITHDFESVVEKLYAVVGGFTYRPYSCSIKPMPFLYPLDCISYTDKNKVAHNTIITNTTFKMNMSNEIAGKGETVKKNSYSNQNPLNTQQAVVVQKVKKQIATGMAEVRQKFTAADGLLQSAITAEVTRATGAEEVLFSTIQQTSEAITLEVTRATEAEEALGSHISATADAITAEVTRATGAEQALSSQLSLTADAIAAKVSATGGNDQSFSWSLTADGFTLKSNNETVMQVTADGLTVKGSIEAVSGTIGGFTLQDGALYASSGGTELQPNDGVFISPSFTEYYHWITNTIKFGSENQLNNKEDISHAGWVEFSQARCILHDNWVIETKIKETSGATILNRPYYHNKYYPLFEIQDTDNRMPASSSGAFTVVIFFGFENYEHYAAVSQGTSVPIFEIRIIEGSINDLRTNAGSGNVVPLVWKNSSGGSSGGGGTIVV